MTEPVAICCPRSCVGGAGALVESCERVVVDAAVGCHHEGDTVTAEIAQGVVGDVEVGSWIPGG